MPTMDQCEAWIPDTYNARTTRHAFRTCLRRFLEWATDEGVQTLGRDAFVAFKRHLLDKGYANRTVQAYLAHIRGMVREAASRDEVPIGLLHRIELVKSPPTRGHSVGVWLKPDELSRLIATPGADKLIDVRDTAVLALLAGCALRRSGLVGIMVHQYRDQADRKVLANVEGKGHRTRTVPVPVWAAAAVDRWLEESGITDGHLIRRIHYTGWGEYEGSVWSTGIQPLAVNKLLNKHAEVAGLDVTPHDLRRSAARIMYDAGAPLPQIQATLGHARLETTMHYINAQQDLEQAPCDVMPVSLGAS